MDEEARRMEDALFALIKRKRRNFYDRAAQRGIITPEQADRIYLMFLSETIAMMAADRAAATEEADEEVTS